MAIPVKEQHNGNFTIRSGSEKPGTMELWCQSRPEATFHPEAIWAIRFFLDREQRLRDRALFELAIDSKLRGCDLVQLKIGDLVLGPKIRTRAAINIVVSAI